MKGSEMICPVCHDVGNCRNTGRNTYVCDSCKSQIAIKPYWQKSSARSVRVPKTPRHQTRRSLYY